MKLGRPATRGEGRTKTLSRLASHDASYSSALTAHAHGRHLNLGKPIPKGRQGKYMCVPVDDVLSAYGALTLIRMICRARRHQGTGLDMSAQNSPIAVVVWTADFSADSRRIDDDDYSTCMPTAIACQHM